MELGYGLLLENDASREKNQILFQKPVLHKSRVSTVQATLLKKLPAKQYPILSNIINDEMDNN